MIDSTGFIVICTLRWVDATQQATALGHVLPQLRNIAAEARKTRRNNAKAAKCGLELNLCRKEEKHRRSESPPAFELGESSEC